MLEQGCPGGSGQLSTISWLGCYIETVSPLTPGTLVQIRLNCFDIVLDISAVTVSATPLFGMAMEFTAVSEAQENTLKRIVARAREALPEMPRAEVKQQIV